MSRPRKTRIVLAVTGSIAAYKAAEVARYFMKRGCTVRVVMSNAAEKFISALTFESITQQPVLRSFWDETQPGAIGHIELADWADAVVVAPASADCIAKIAHGFADSPLLAVILATKAPLVIAPAMNVNMYEHPQTQENIEHLKGRGVAFVEPEHGELACGWKGRGRLAQASEIFFETKRSISPQDLIGKRVLITTGPTREMIDPVRYISNRSSGKMGISLAHEAFRRGAVVTLIHGPLSSKPKLPRSIRKVPVISAHDMRQAVSSHVSATPSGAQYDIVIMAAAVADYRPEHPSDEKIKKATNPTSLALTATSDILKEVGEQKDASAPPFLVGFAVETGSIQQLVTEARRKLDSKNADLIVGNLAQDSFDKDTNRVFIVGREGPEQEIATATKRTISIHIFDAIVSRLRVS